MAIRRNFNTSRISTRDSGQLVEEMMASARDTRSKFERKWYDNNFFDDGYHFRYLSRAQNKIVDVSSKIDSWNPIRAIPKASRQIRGVANLLTANDFIPIVYPEKVNREAFVKTIVDPTSGQPIKQLSPEFEMAQQESKRVAKMSGHWLMEEFKNQDIAEKLAQMILLAAKHNVSFMQIWPDANEEKIKTQVYDAFDIYLLGDLDNLHEQPFVGKGVKRMIAEIKANELFDEGQRMLINPDNRYASSEIKEAYMNARYGRSGASDRNATIILKEFFIREYLDEYNSERIRKQKNAGNILGSRKAGDPVIRHVWVAGNIWLRDVYEDLPTYPFVEYRMEPGPIYSTPLIERFIPANKSLDIISSRIERYTNSFPLGIMLKRQGEQINVSNIAGGQQVEYKTIPPSFEQQAPLPNHVFNYLSVLTNFIEEQGVTTTTLGKLPSGVKSGKAIESLKESEYSNLVIAQRRLRQTVQEIAYRFMDLADRFFVTPQTYSFLEKGEPTYFDIVGKTAIDKRKEINVNDLPDGVVPISKEYKVEIEVQSGLAYTKEGQKIAAKELGDYMVQLLQIGVVTPEVFKVFIETFLEAYQFGPVSEFMEALSQAGESGGLSYQQIQAVKIAVLEVLKDAGVVGPEFEQTLVDSTKVGVAEALKDTGMLDRQNNESTTTKPPSQSLSFKDLPPEGKVQMAANAGIQLDQNSLEAEEQIKQATELAKTAIRDKGKVSE